MKPREHHSHTDMKTWSIGRFYKRHEISFLVLQILNTRDNLKWETNKSMISRSQVQIQARESENQQKRPLGFWNKSNKPNFCSVKQSICIGSSLPSQAPLTKVALPPCTEVFASCSENVWTLGVFFVILFILYHT